ncbi:hypothetical protein HDU89_000256 [Geranomyces variabilis]|nr:hypothetical protein HDU89_000256 [Geranomyces variabilis]
MSTDPGHPPPAYQHTTQQDQHQHAAQQLSSPCLNHQWSKPYYPRSAYCMAVFLFPIGLLCCLRMREERCQVCGEEHTLDEPEEDPAKKAQADQAYRLGFAAGAIGQLVHGGGGA